MITQTCKVIKRVYQKYNLRHPSVYIRLSVIEIDSYLELQVLFVVSQYGRNRPLNMASEPYHKNMAAWDLYLNACKISYMEICTTVCVVNKFYDMNVF